jgi:3-methyladenine DNA glycosylase/8-oxoguanine DNA glycosylase
LTLEAARPQVTLGSLLARHRHGRADPTLKITATDFWRTARTPDGPGTLHISLGSAAHPTVEAYGAGAEWLRTRAAGLLGHTDVLPVLTAHHPAVAKALHRHGVPPTSASGLVLPDLINAILGQRVTSIEAFGQWAALCRHEPETAPGPTTLLLPPDPAQLAKTPAWQYHRMGIERSRAETIAEVCRRAGRVHEVAEMSIADGYARLMAFSGVGLWTAAMTMWTALGDPDAVPVGDFHMKNVVAYALAGEPRGTDERMLELLEPYAGHRGLALELLALDRWKAPKYGPRQRIRSIARW